MIIPDKYKNHFRRIAHPRKDLFYPPEQYQFCLKKYGVCSDVSAEAVAMELLNYYDPYDTGLDIGHKEIRHNGKKDKLNELFFGKWNKYKSTNSLYLNSIKRSEINNRRNEISDTRSNTCKIFDHITKKKVIYGTANPFSPIRVLGTDVDNHTDDPELVLPFLSLFQSFYPGSFYDGGSSGKSLHYYPKIYMIPLYNYYCRNSDITCEWADYANTIIRHTSYIFRIYSYYIFSPEHSFDTKILTNGEIKYKPKYHVFFDAFKASYPQYEFYRDKYGRPHQTKMTKNGVLHKLPNIYTVQDLITFRDSPVYSIIHHLCVSFYIGNMVLLSGCCDGKVLKKITHALQEIENILMAHSVLLPLQAKNIVAFESDESETVNEEGQEIIEYPIEEENEKTKEREKERLCIYNSTFENVDDICLEHDAMLRSRKYLYYCVTLYMTRHGREPTIDEYIQDYREDVGTGTENPEDRKRLKYIYNTNIIKMRKYFLGTLSQQINMMEDKLDITQDDIDRMSTYGRRIWKRDIAITAVWMGLCLCNTGYIEKKQWWSINKGNHFTRQLTVPMSALKEFFACLKSKKLNKYGCNDSKAKVLREMLEALGWFKCVDDSVVIASHNGCKGGRARRYVLLKAHPNYNNFERIVGKDKIEYWISFRQEQLRIRGLKGRSRKVG